MPKGITGDEFHFSHYVPGQLFEVYDLIEADGIVNNGYIGEFHPHEILANGFTTEDYGLVPIGINADGYYAPMKISMAKALGQSYWSNQKNENTTP